MIALNLQLFGGGGSGSGGGNGNNGTSNTVKLGAYITSKGKIKADEQYILLNARDDTKKNAPGSYLLQQITDKKLWYDPDKGMWVSATGRNYDIRRRRR